MKQETIDKLLERYKLHLQERHDKSNSQDEKELIKTEQEMVDKFGIDGMHSSTYLFSAGDLVKLTIEFPTEIKEIEARILLFADTYNIYFIEDENRILNIMNANVVMMELMDIPDDDLCKYNESSNEKSKKYFEGKAEESYG